MDHLKIATRVAGSTLLQELTEPDLGPEVDGEGVITLRALPDGDNVVAPPQGARLFLAPHPEGSDRGGYVVWATRGNERCYWDPSGQWIA